jgi:hypothetical protein
MWYENGQWNTTYPAAPVQQPDDTTKHTSPGGGGPSLPAPKTNTTINQTANTIISEPVKQPVQEKKPEVPKNETKVESPTGMFLGNIDFAAAVQSFFAAVFSFFAKLLDFL